jgi:hypothetical protein
MKFINKLYFPQKHFTVAEDDNADIPESVGTEGVMLYCSADGTAVVTDKYGTILTYDVVAGDIVPVLVRRLGETSTGTFYGLQ